MSPIYHLRCYSWCVPKFFVTGSGSTVPVSVQVLASVAKICSRNTHTDKLVDNISDPTSPFASLTPSPTSSQALCLPRVPAPVWLDSSNTPLLRANGKIAQNICSPDSSKGPASDVWTLSVTRVFQAPDSCYREWSQPFWVALDSRLHPKLLGCNGAGSGESMP